MAKKSLADMGEQKVLMSQIKAFCEVVEGILKNHSSAEIGRYSSYKSMANTYNDFVEQVKRVLKTSSLIYTINIDNIPEIGDTTWTRQKDILENVFLYAKMLLATLEGNMDFIDDEFDNLENFFLSRLRAAIFSKPEKEIDIQNAVESLLLGRGLGKGTDYDRESGKFEFSGKEYIPDFVLSNMNLCIEVKLIREGRKSKIIEEICSDITAYRTVYPRQLFIVYDLGVVQNEEEFKRDIEKSDGVKIVLIKQ